MSIPGLDVVSAKIVSWLAAQVGSEIFDDVLADFRMNRNVTWNPPLDTLKKCKEELVERSEKTKGGTYVTTWKAHRWNGVQDITLRPVST